MTEETFATILLAALFALPFVVGCALYWWAESDGRRRRERERKRDDESRERLERLTRETESEQRERERLRSLGL